MELLNLEERIKYHFGTKLHKFYCKELNCEYYIDNTFEPIIEINHYTGKVAYKLGIFDILHNYSGYDANLIETEIKKYLNDNYGIKIRKLAINFDYSSRQVKQEFFKHLNLI